MVIQADNSLVVGTLMMAGSVVTGLLAAVAGVGTLSGQFGTTLGLAGTLVGGAAAVGLHLATNEKDSQAKQQMYAAFQRADETGCYTRDELYRWYRENVASG
jgi:outer membrane lipoprotein SlyB